jgi:hypothetical protein
MHILFLWEPALSPADVIEGVCYESTKLINGSLFQANAFAWENTKAIFSVSHSQMPKVAEYIGNQKAVHSEKSFSKELDDFLILHALK